jgi:hypothetical protein
MFVFSGSVLDLAGSSHSGGGRYEVGLVFGPIGVFLQVEA